MASSEGIQLPAGDIQSCFRKLESLLRVIKYPGCVDYKGLHKGDPSAFLPIVSFTLTSFSPAFSEQLMASGLELSGKTDLRFTDTLYKVLRDVFHYKPVLNKQQFLQTGFSQRKLSFICDIISLVLQRHRQLIKHKLETMEQEEHSSRTRTRVSRLLPRPTGRNESLEKVSKKPFVPDKVGKPSSFVSPPTKEARSSHDAARSPRVEADATGFPADEITVTEGVAESNECLLHASEVERRLSALETQLQSVLSELNKLNMLEKRLEKLETLKNTEKSDGLVVTISRDSWENLMSRVLLLETKQECWGTGVSSGHWAGGGVSPGQMEASLTCQPSSSSLSHSSCPDASQPSFDTDETNKPTLFSKNLVDMKERLERISNMLKNSSNLLKEPEIISSP